MIDRRGFLGGALATGWASMGSGQSPLATDQGPGTASLAVRIGRVLEGVRTGGRRLPGMVGAILQGVRPVEVGASGLRKVGSPGRIEPNDRFHLGSCTKAMTATMLGTLVDDGKLGWDSTIGQVFAGDRGAIHPGYLGVTLAQLLAHRAGLPADVDWWGLAPGSPVMEQRAALLGRTLREPPGDRPGSKFRYSNVGYVLAGLMAERVTGTSWEDLMRARLFGPLGMASAGFGPPGDPGRVDQPWGHRAEGDRLLPTRLDNPPVLGPAGTVHASMADWARFATLHLRGEVGGSRLLKPQTLQALHGPRPGEDYAGGWIVADRSWAGGKALTHGGSNTCWYASIWLAPARGFALMVAANAGGDPATKACDEAIGQFIGLVEPGRGSVPR